MNLFSNQHFLSLWFEIFMIFDHELKIDSVFSELLKISLVMTLIPHHLYFLKLPQSSMYTCCSTVQKTLKVVKFEWRKRTIFHFNSNTLFTKTLKQFVQFRNRTFHNILWIIIYSIHFDFICIFLQFEKWCILKVSPDPAQ